MMGRLDCLIASNVGCIQSKVSLEKVYKKMSKGHFTVIYFPGESF